MGLELKGFTREDMRSIKAHVLVTFGDHDATRPEHAVEMMRLIPNAQLFVYPGGDHFILWTNREGLLAPIAAFLDSPMPESKKVGKRIRRGRLDVLKGMMSRTCFASG
jgi:hypothetical protein